MTLGGIQNLFSSDKTQVHPRPPPCPKSGVQPLLSCCGHIPHIPALPGCSSFYKNTSLCVSRANAAAAWPLGPRLLALREHSPGCYPTIPTSPAESATPSHIPEAGSSPPCQWPQNGPSSAPSQILPSPKFRGRGHATHSGQQEGAGSRRSCVVC